MANRKYPSLIPETKLLSVGKMRIEKNTTRNLLLILCPITCTFQFYYESNKLFNFIQHSVVCY